MKQAKQQVGQAISVVTMPKSKIGRWLLVVALAAVSHSPVLFCVGRSAEPNCRLATPYQTKTAHRGASVFLPNDA